MAQLFPDDIVDSSGLSPLSQALCRILEQCLSDEWECHAVVDGAEISHFIVVSPDLGLLVLLISSCQPDEFASFSQGLAQFQQDCIDSAKQKLQQHEQLCDENGDVGFPVGFGILFLELTGSEVADNSVALEQFSIFADDLKRIADDGDVDQLEDLFLEMMEDVDFDEVDEEQMEVIAKIWHLASLPEKAHSKALVEQSSDDVSGTYTGAQKDELMHGQGIHTWPDGAKYVGEWKDGKKHGQGTYTLSDGRKYVGEWKDDKRHGQGTLIDPNGAKYIGEWKDDKRHEQGTQRWPEGAKYVGGWKVGNFHGQGTFTWPDGAKYVGDWKGGNRHGQGIHTDHDGTKYVGEWKDDKRHGQGIHTTPDGAKYVGELKDGKWHGQGTYTWPDGEKYVGEWKDDKSHGQGARTWPDGTKYVGESKDDKSHGQGTRTWPDGTKYVGEWKDAKRHGQGIHTWPDGAKYVGDWKCGKWHGQGTFTTPDGAKYVGGWKDGKCHDQGTYTTPDGAKYVGGWKDGERHGQGTFTYSDGAKYVGGWKDSKRHGQGIHTGADGTKCVGEWKDDKSHGQGTSTSPDGAKYVGEWKVGNFHGQGTFTLPDGAKYTGEWRDNKRHGQGTCVYADGRIEKGEWRDDEKQEENSLPRTGQNFTEPVTGMEMIWVPGGEFAMGGWDDEAEKDEKPVHQVKLDGFWLGKFTVTQGQYQRIMGSNPSHFQKGDDFPVDDVTWEDAQEYILELKRQSGLSFRLPAEAEWEYAARSGGKKELYAGGKPVGAVAWYGKNSGGTTNRAGTKYPNGLRIYDMSGNVWEWCFDWFDREYYSRSPVSNPQGASTGSNRVVRGGSWDNDGRFVRSAFRNHFSPSDRFVDLGFRLALGHELK